jgi:hypothetical protein
MTIPNRLPGLLKHNPLLKTPTFKQFTNHSSFTYVVDGVLEDFRH